MLRGPLVLAALIVLAACAPLQQFPAPPAQRTAAPTRAAATEPPRPTAAPATSPTDAGAAAPATQTADAADPPLDTPALLAGAVPASRDPAALAQAFGLPTEDDATPPRAASVGDVEQFWVLDKVGGSYVRLEAELRYIGPTILMYVDTRLAVDQADIERSARTFEQQIYPRDRQLFGSEPSPGVDGDPRLTVLNTNLSGAGGYFSSDDAISGSANRFSNRREMFVIGVNSYPVGSDSYAATLAHEFQHMIGWNVQRRSPTWLSEGMASLAEDLNGYVSQGTASSYLQSPDLQLTAWTAGSDSGGHYGMARLFLRYFYQHYAGDDGLRAITAASADTLLDTFVAQATAKRPDIGGFADLFGDWAVANLVNDPQIDGGRYAYDLLPSTVTPSAPQPGASMASVNQFGADYLGPLVGPAVISFDGADTVSLTGSGPAEGRYAWWSGRGDESVATLTRELDLSGVPRATLLLKVWHEIERAYDHAYVTVSQDGGATWTALRGRTTTADDPQGQSLGHALTGVSGAPDADINAGARGTWVDEEMDLTPYVGRTVQLRFWLVSDAAINGPGLMIDDVRVPEIGLADGAEAGQEGWSAQGFARVAGVLPQQWGLRVVRQRADGTAVEPVAPDAEGRAEVRVQPGERAVLVVYGATPITTEPAEYTLSISPE